MVNGEPEARLSLKRPKKLSSERNSFSPRRSLVKGFNRLKRYSLAQDTVSLEDRTKELHKEASEDLVSACSDADELNLHRVESLLRSGANPGYVRVLYGLNGTHERYSAIHGILHPRNWKTRKQAAIALKILMVVLDAGAPINSRVSTNNRDHLVVCEAGLPPVHDQESYFSSAPACEIALGLILSEESDADASENRAGGVYMYDIKLKLLKVMMTHKADVNICSSTTVNSLSCRGVKTTRVWHKVLDSNSVDVLEALIPAIDVEGRSTIHVEGIGSTTYAYEQDRTLTGLHIVSGSTDIPAAVRSAFLLLEAGADVNSVMTSVEVEVDEHDISMSYRVCETPLHIAILSGNVTLVYVLVKFGANTTMPRIRCRRSLFPFYSLVKFGRRKSVGSVAEAYDVFVDADISEPYLTLPSTMASQTSAAIADDMQAALEGLLPEKYQSILPLPMKNNIDDLI
mmetsp:Transcript_15967/g.20979  ORF Transcript_15967/g.20979 Transcript_15967/m.20979 type:complete len:458 (-) Transcript_15967:304-1677(-)|eukprot:CAMPEP_0184007182 /NCGR_PEP_ID=MMETSP0954-20121128/1164_1 /TAXON_ID=627963 /ORGANISM="Aplanochytrium sp, Strain PBS07" /LENGTH=457 /DNA_ID=CAMNT_0026285929 /DNA_START=509 /DNA_END=1882 /DNA_ORIENTATION=+